MSGGKVSDMLEPAPPDQTSLCYKPLAKNCLNRITASIPACTSCGALSVVLNGGFTATGDWFDVMGDAQANLFREARERRLGRRGTHRPPMEAPAGSQQERKEGMHSTSRYLHG